jgi:hypothetical protein
MNDSTAFMQSLPDTLRVMNISQNPSIPAEYVGLLGVVIGASIAILGNLLLAKRQAHFQIQNTLFLRRLEVYLKFIELLWPGGILQHQPASSKTGSFPIPYTSNKRLSEWLNTLTNYVSSNRMLLDENTLRNFEKLNQRVLEDLKHISDSSTSDSIDERTRSIGLQSAATIHELCKEAHNSSWDYFKKTYRVQL